MKITTWTATLNPSSITGDIASRIFNGVNSVSWTTTYDDTNSAWHKYDDLTQQITDSFTVDIPEDSGKNIRADAEFTFDDNIKRFFDEAYHEAGTPGKHYAAFYTKFGHQDKFSSYRSNGKRLFAEEGNDYLVIRIDTENPADDEWIGSARITLTTSDVSSVSTPGAPGDFKILPK